MYEFWYDYGKSKYNKKAKLCYMDTDSFVVHVKTEDIFKSIAKYVKERYDTSNHELKRPLRKEKKTKKNNRFNERWIRWKNHERICGINSRSL